MLTFALLGLGLSVLALLAGLLLVGLRGEAQVESYRREGLEVEREASLRRGCAGSIFKGVSAGFSLYAEKSTREVLDLLRRGRWQEGLPWAAAMVGLLGVMFFLPMAIVAATGVGGPWPWVAAVGFLLATLYAAWPRA
ncbi:MAG: hypothetical protein NZ528_10725 [Caldilineales bacterium]|nr:hypothetical protein [Caldilineales bacterium]MDW8317633.1 hypothetical protein [Anaerolineae bacterium]